MYVYFPFCFYGLNKRINFFRCSVWDAPGSQISKKTNIEFFF
jgi:hypothetical protein